MELHTDRELETAIRRMVRPVDLTTHPAAFDSIWANFESRVEPGRVARSRRWYRIPAIAIAMVAVVAATAVAAIPELRRALGFEGANVGSNIAAVEDGPKSATEAERARLTDALEHRSDGAARPSGIGDLHEPSVLLDEGDNRVIAAADENGTVCFSGSGTEGVVSCSPTLHEAGVIFQMRNDQFPDGRRTYMLYGLVADRVDDVLIVTANGETVAPIAQDENAFFWEGTQLPRAIRTVSPHGIHEAKLPSE